MTLDAPLIGYRVWALGEAGGLCGDAWTTATATAACTMTPGWHCERPPALAHSCGLYAMDVLDAAVRQPHPWERQVVVGAVKAWGRIVRHEAGFRAEHMKILALLDQPDAAAVADRYEVPLLARDELVAYAAICGDLA